MRRTCVGFVFGGCDGLLRRFSSHRAEIFLL